MKTDPLWRASLGAALPQTQSQGPVAATPLLLFYIIHQHFYLFPSKWWLKHMQTVKKPSQMTVLWRKNLSPHLQKGLQKSLHKELIQRVTSVPYINGIFNKKSSILT
ncbi:uncharacterized protein LOC143742528 [Siphateles boraxobius]|uniref:uncharacterized protein LOC143742528 n=1 Tax=Siphateles boraxobius TaxID=180520 RepID=UPI004064738D